MAPWRATRIGSASRSSSAWKGCTAPGAATTWLSTALTMITGRSRSWPSSTAPTPIVRDRSDLDQRHGGVRWRRGHYQPPCQAACRYHERSCGYGRPGRRSACLPPRPSLKVPTMDQAQVPRSPGTQARQACGRERGPRRLGRREGPTRPRPGPSRRTFRRYPAASGRRPRTQGS